MTISDSLSQDYEQEIRVWHERRIANLMRDYGWLTLVALDWLEEGTNSIPNVGTLTLKDNTITFKAVPGEVVPGASPILSGKPFTGGALRSDAEEGGPDMVMIGSRAFTVIKRGGRYAVRMWDKDSPRRKDFKGIERYPVSLKWKIEARWEPYDPPKHITVATVIPGYDAEYPVPGVATFSIDGKEYRLEPVLEEPGGDYFFIIGDKTNGKETYGGGRYLYSTPAKDGRVIIDFNKAYNPPCVFTEYATCPLPPPGNRLAIPVTAGEKNYEHD
jgi:uncharacterized protein (DUF1684 family)